MGGSGWVGLPRRRKSGKAAWVNAGSGLIRARSVYACDLRHWIDGYSTVMCVFASGENCKVQTTRKLTNGKRHPISTPLWQYKRQQKVGLLFQRVGKKLQLHWLRSERPGLRQK